MNCRSWIMSYRYLFLQPCRKRSWEYHAQALDFTVINICSCSLALCLLLGLMAISNVSLTKFWYVNGKDKNIKIWWRWKIYDCCNLGLVLFFYFIYIQYSIWLIKVSSYCLALCYSLIHTTLHPKGCVDWNNVKS